MRGGESGPSQDRRLQEANPHSPGRRHHHPPESGLTLKEAYNKTNIFFVLGHTYVALSRVQGDKSSWVGPGSCAQGSGRWEGDEVCEGIDEEAG